MAPHRGNSDFSKLVTNIWERCVFKTQIPPITATQMPPITANNYSEDGQADKDKYPDTCLKILSKVILMSNMKALTNIYYFVK